MILYDPVNIMITHICQRNVISRKGESGIIIFKIKCLSVSLSALVDEAEHTFISAGTMPSISPCSNSIPNLFLIVLLPPYSSLSARSEVQVLRHLQDNGNQNISFLVIDNDQAVPAPRQVLRNTSVLTETDDMPMFHIVFSNSTTSNKYRSVFRQIFFISFETCVFCYICFWPSFIILDFFKKAILHLFL